MHRASVVVALLAAVWHSAYAITTVNQYGPPEIVQAISNFGSFDTGDINNNGATQIVVYDPNNNNNGIAIYTTPLTSNPNPVTTIADTFASGTSTLQFPSIRFIDFQENGYLDIIFTNPGGIAYSLNNNNPNSFSFANYSQITSSIFVNSTANSYITQLLVGHINSDQYPDIVFISTGVTALANEVTPINGVLLNPGGVASSTWTYSEIIIGSYGTSNFASATLIDLTGDGLLDLVAGVVEDYQANNGYYFGTTTTLVYVNTGSGSFSSYISVYQTAAIQVEVVGKVAWYGLNAVGDVNGDGLMDIVTGESGSSPTSVLTLLLQQPKGNGSSLVFNASTVSFNFSDPSLPNGNPLVGHVLGVAIQDINNDGLEDLVFQFAKYMYYALQTVQNPPTYATPVTLTKGSTFYQSSQILNFLLMDVNDDDFDDVVAVTTGNVIFFINQEPTQAIPTNSPVALSYLYTGSLYSPATPSSGTLAYATKACVALNENSGEPYGGYLATVNSTNYCCVKQGITSGNSCTFNACPVSLSYTASIIDGNTCFVGCYSAGNQYIPPPSLTKPYRVFQGARYDPPTTLQLLDGNANSNKYSIIASTKVAPSVTKKRSDLTNPTANYYGGGYLVSYGQGKISNEYACVYAGSLSGSAPEYTCTVGGSPCDFTVGNFFYDLSSSKCYARCYTH